MMKSWGAVGVVCALLLVGCSSGDGTESTSDTSAERTRVPSLDAASIGEKLSDAGFDCGSPGPYEPDEGEMDLGVEPVEVVECTSGDVTVSGAIWANDTDAKVLLALVETFACGFGETGFALIDGGAWTVAAETTSGEGDADPAVLEDAAEALGVEVTTTECPEVDDSEVQPGSADDQGSREAPLVVGEAHDIGDGWTVKVAEFNPDATALLATPDEYGFNFNDAPPAGQQYVQVGVDATYDGEDSRQPYDITFKLVGDSAVAIDLSSSGCSAADPTWSSLGEAFPGGTLSGNMCALVATEDVGSLVLIAEPTLALSGNRSFLALQ